MHMCMLPMNHYIVGHTKYFILFVQLVKLYIKVYVYTDRCSYTCLSVLEQYIFTIKSLSLQYQTGNEPVANFVQWHVSSQFLFIHLFIEALIGMHQQVYMCRHLYVYVSLCTSILLRIYILMFVLQAYVHVQIYVYSYAC